MDIRIVRMHVGQRIVDMRMCVWLAGGCIRRMSVPVMVVVAVGVRVRQRCVGMDVPVALGEVQPDAERHESRRCEQRQGDRLTPEYE